jgi:hypothetical protein
MKSAAVDDVAAPAGSVDDVWQRTLEALEAAQPLMVGFARDGSLERLDDAEAVIRFKWEKEASGEMMQQPKRFDALLAAMNVVLGRDVTLKIVVDEPPPPPPKAAPPPRVKRTFDAALAEAPAPSEAPAAGGKLTPEQKAEAEQDPTVKAAMAEFEAQVVRVEPA